MSENKEEYQKPLNFEEAANFLEEKKNKDVKAEAKKVDRPISHASPEDMRKFLTYAIKFLKDDRLRTLLKLRLDGWTHKQIAWEFGRVKPEMIIELEKTALKMTMDEIARRKLIGIPILGGL